jgi:hypothetical protein
MCTHRSTNIIFASHYEDPCSIPCQINSKLTHRSDRWPVAIKRGVTLKNYLKENHKKSSTIFAGRAQGAFHHILSQQNTDKNAKRKQFQSFA